MKQRFYISLFIFLIFIVVITFSKKERRKNFPEIDKSEEPFSTLTRPYKSVHAVHILDGGIGSIALRIVDANGRVEILVALRDASGENRSKVIRNAFVSWDEKIGFHDIKTPSSYEDIPGNVAVLNDADSAVNSMLRILDFYHDKSSGPTTAAYRAMTNPNYVSP